MNPINYLGDYIEGSFGLPEKVDGSLKIISPADTKDFVGEVNYSFENVERACHSAHKAFKEWSHTSLDDRKKLLLKLKDLFDSNVEKMAHLISRETGKALWETTTEAKGLAAKISVTIDKSLDLVSEQKIVNALPGVDGYIRFKPRGVMAVLGPFNFPAHLPNGHIIPALLTGNTVIFKPSDKTPLVGQLMAELIHQAGFPKGVFNLVQGEGLVGKRLVSHELVDGILFTGSYDVGLKIKQDTLSHHWKILALEMGGKNCSIVWKDADLEKAVYENIVGSFLSSGQRCSCTSKIMVHKEIHDEFVEIFHKTAKKLKVDHWSKNPFMGPLISSDSVDKYIRFQEIAKREGAECLMRGKSLDLEYQGNYVSPSINLMSQHDPKSVYQSCEIFGPNVGILKIDDFDQALEVNNSTGFGLVASIFTKDESLFRKALLEARVGLLNWNRTTNGASSQLPFGGMGKSGNDRPSAHFAVYYTTVPVASLQDMNPFDATKVFPGIEYGRN